MEMRKINQILFSVCLVLILSGCNNTGNFIVKNGLSEYQIVIADNATEYEKLAASELQNYLKQVSSTELKIIEDSEAKSDFEILIGKSNRLSETILSDIDQLDEDGFIIKTEGNKLIIAGGKEKGSLYRVYTFLEDFLDCRMYSPEVINIPKNKTILLPEIDLKQEPAFAYRELHMPLSRKSESYRNWHKLDAKEGKNEWGMFVHTFDDFIPVEEYFESNPEYFSFLNVQRIPDGQLCLSNAEVFDIVVEDLNERMQKNPQVLYWSVSQNDTYKACECDECKEQYDLYDGYSGAMVHFVNRVADQFPDKVISS